MTKEEGCSYSEELIQNRFTQAVLIGLRNKNIRNELHPILKSNSLSDEELLENLSYAINSISVGLIFLLLKPLRKQKNL